MKSILIALCLFFSTVSTALYPSTISPTQLKPIYGNDNRRDLFESDVSSALREASRSTGLITWKSSLITSSDQPNYFLLTGNSLGERLSLCPSERFYSQPSRGYCSGFLVGSDIFVTAGHCFDEEHTCEKMAVVFDFGYQVQKSDPTIISREKVFYCQSVIKQNGHGDDVGNDFALIRLDRKVGDRRPLSFRDEGMIKPGTEVIVIGHPMGLPTKIAGGARVSTSTEYFFDADLDAFIGNSGSAVFAGNTGKIEGILVSGEDDFDWHEDNQCATAKRCLKDNCTRENVTPATTFAKFIPPETNP